jgi:hypothetical protein
MDTLRVHKSRLVRIRRITVHCVQEQPINTEVVMSTAE